MSIKKQIKDHLKKQNGWIHGGTLERCARAWNCKASTISRRARELAANGEIDRRENEKGEVMYKQLVDKQKSLAI
jgi:hypothetical protein